MEQALATPTAPLWKIWLKIVTSPSIKTFSKYRSAARLRPIAIALGLLSLLSSLISLTHMISLRQTFQFPNDFMFQALYVQGLILNTIFQMLQKFGTPWIILGFYHLMARLFQTDKTRGSFQEFFFLVMPGWISLDSILMLINFFYFPTWSQQIQNPASIAPNFQINLLTGLVTNLAYLIYLSFLGVRAIAAVYGIPIRKSLMYLVIPSYLILTYLLFGGFNGKILLKLIFNNSF